MIQIRRRTIGKRSRSSAAGCTRRQFLRFGGAGLATLALPLAGWPLPRSASELDVKIGQMILAGFRGYTAEESNPITADLEARALGGVVLFDYDVPGHEDKRNIQSPTQVAALTRALQATTPVPPLLVSVDQEGGPVSRLTPAHGFPPTYAPEYLGRRNDLAFTRACAETTAATLQAAGVNLNLAPVVDLNLNPDNPIIGRYGRSFSADPEIVTAHSLEVIRAHRERGILTTLKHFPGHGSAAADSHRGFVDVTGSWSEVELEPFRNLITAGACDAVMTAHIFNAQLDPAYPATLSYATISRLLRGELGWDGVVISDDLGMGAIAQDYGLATAIALAIRAGVDILAFANNGPVFDPALPARAFALIKALVVTGVLSETRIDASYRRIMRLKARLAP